MKGCEKDHEHKLPCGCTNSDSIGMLIKYMHENRKTCESQRDFVVRAVSAARSPPPRLASQSPPLRCRRGLAATPTARTRRPAAAPAAPATVAARARNRLRLPLSY